MDQLQATVLVALLPKDGWLEYSQIINEEVLHDNKARSIYAHIKSLHDKRAVADITLDALRLDILSTYRQGETRADELLEVVDVLRETPEVDKTTVRDSVDKFASRELCAKAAQLVATHLGEADFDPEVPADLMQRALEISQGVNTAVLDFVDSGLPGEIDDRTAICPLGISNKLDRDLGGGVASGELLVVLAPPARGKTSYLCAIGARAAAEGRGVLHITLEIPARRVARRYDSVLTGLSANEMVDRPGAVRAARTMVTRSGGFVKIKDWSYRSASPADIKGLVKRLRAKGEIIDLVVVDYLELMTPNQGKFLGRREQRHVYGQLGKDIRAAAVELDVKMVTAWQVNRAGAGMDTYTTEHVSECWDIIKHADIILALNQSDPELDNNIMRIAILKQRNSTERPQISVFSNLNTNQIRDLRDVEISTDIVIGGMENGERGTDNPNKDSGHNS
jgi:replicative DNA helicase